MDKTANLGTEKIGKLLLTLAVPSIIAQVVNILYNMVDRIYLGRMVNGSVAMSALAVSLPVVTLILAFSQLAGVGGAPLAAIKLGENKKDGAEKIMTNSFVMLLATGILLTAAIFIFQEPLLYAFGADSTNIGMAKEYVGIYCLGTIFVQISFGMNAYINTQGQAKFGMATVIIGAVLNIILDPIFIFGLNMGVSGAALATIIAQAVSALWVLKFFFGK
ncbi:MAG: MATE family efflux transporter, partial [Oscillospiraceae bacterium]